jgi:DNA-binding FadR family transcriptional regulator
MDIAGPPDLDVRTGSASIGQTNSQDDKMTNSASPPNPTSAPFAAVPRSATYLQVAEQIRRAILDGSLPAGQPLPPERELTRQFAVSRTTVREALRQLEAQGLLASHGRTSPMRAADPEFAVDRFREALTHVVRLRDLPLPDLVELRLAVEGAAVARAAAAPVMAELARARGALATMQAPRTAQAEFHQADVAFHTALVAASGNQALHVVMLAVKDSIDLQLGQAMQSRSFSTLRPRIVKEHAALLRAVERGDGKEATRLLHAHLSDFYFT